MTKIIFAFLILTIGVTSYAAVVVDRGGATGVGDGGTGVVCITENGQKTYELLDLYEANNLHGISFDTFPSGETYRDEISKLQGNFEGLTGDRSLTERFFFAKITWPSYEKGLSDSFDVFPLVVPLAANCSLKPIGFRYAGALRPIVEVDREAWLALDARRQALLMIHEALHDEFPAGYEGAAALRQVVAFIAAPPDFQMKNAAVIRRVLRTKKAAQGSEWRRD